MEARPTNAHKRKYMKFVLKRKPTDHSDFVGIVTRDVDNMKALFFAGPYRDERLSFYYKMQLYFAETANFTRYTKTLEISQSEEVIAKKVYKRKAIFRGLSPLKLVPVVEKHIEDFTATEDSITRMKPTQMLPETHLGAMEYNSNIQGPLQRLENAVALMQARVEKMQSTREVQEMVNIAMKSVIALRERYPVCTDDTASENPYGEAVLREFEFTSPHQNRRSLISHWLLLSQQERHEIEMRGVFRG